MSALAPFGWNARWQQLFKPHAAEGLSPARVVVEHRAGYRLATEYGERTAVLAGRLRHSAEHHAELPATGDFVAARLGEAHDATVVHAVLPRLTALARQAAGDRAHRQILAANIDIVFVVTTYEQDFNVRRLERYVALVWDAGAMPVILLNKSDLSDELSGRVAQAAAVAAGVPVHAISALYDGTLAALEPYLTPGTTTAFVGSSGVGKSTLLNRLLGRDAEPTREIRESDGRGRHTTTHRQLFIRPGGGIIIDTPGMRELQLGSADAGVDAVFADIRTLAAECRFADCQHELEPGCRVREAIERGVFSEQRLVAYRKLLAELDYAADRTLESVIARKRRDRLGSKAMRQIKERKKER